MRFLETVVLAFFCWLMFAACCSAQCGPNGCQPLQWQPAAAARGEYQWSPVKDQPEYVALYHGDRQIGVYNLATGFYQRKLAGGWSGPARSPIAPPIGDLSGPQGKTYFGLQLPKLGNEEKIWCGASTYSHYEAAEMLEADLRDDTKAPHLTVIDKDPARRRKLAEEIAAAKWQGQIPDKARLQIYDPNLRPNKAILAPFRLNEDLEFQKTGCMVIAQKAAEDPKGRSRPERIYGTASPSVLVDALRTIDPHYDPNRGPLPWLPALPSFNLDFLIIAGLLLLIVGIAIGRSKR